MKAYHVIEDRTRWTKFCPARDKFGKNIGPNNPNAVQWDVTGALRKAYGDYTKGYWEAFRKLRAEVREHGYTEIQYWHDAAGRQHHHVVDLLKRLDI